MLASYVECNLAVPYNTPTHVPPTQQFDPHGSS
jgi:hypothetical protein